MTDVRNYLTEARDYARCDRRALPDVELVLGLLRHIDALTDCVETRDRLLHALVAPREVTR